MFLSLSQLPDGRERVRSSMPKDFFRGGPLLGFLNFVRDLQRAPTRTPDASPGVRVEDRLLILAKLREP